MNGGVRGMPPVGRRRLWFGADEIRGGRADCVVVQLVSQRGRAAPCRLGQVSAQRGATQQTSARCKRTLILPFASTRSQEFNIELRTFFLLGRAKLDPTYMPVTRGSTWPPADIPALEILISVIKVKVTRSKADERTRLACVLVSCAPGTLCPPSAERRQVSCRAPIVLSPFSCTTAATSPATWSSRSHAGRPSPLHRVPGLRDRPAPTRSSRSARRMGDATTACHSPA